MLLSQPYCTSFHCSQGPRWLNPKSPLTPLCIWLLNTTVDIKPRPLRMTECPTVANRTRFGTEPGGRAYKWPTHRFLLRKRKVVFHRRYRNFGELAVIEERHGYWAWFWKVLVICFSCEIFVFYLLKQLARERVSWAEREDVCPPPWWDALAP